MERMICQCCGEALHKRGDLYECRYCGAVYRDDQAERAAELLRGLLDDFKIEQLSNARRRLYETTHEKYPSSQAVTQAAGAVLSISPDDFMARVYLHSHDADPHVLIALLAREAVSEWEAKEAVAWLTRSLDMRALAAVKDFADRHLKGAAKTEALNRIEDEAFKLDSGVYDLSLRRDVFLCYSAEDMPRVIEIMEAFEENALSCFAAFRNLRHGKGAQENYQDAIFRAMKNCRVFVFLSSNSSRDPHRKGVAEELDHLVGDLKDKPRVEFLLEDYPERMPILAKRRLAEAFPHLEYCRDAEDLVVRVSKLLDAEENAEREKARKIAEEASEKAKKEILAEFEAKEAARKAEEAKREEKERQEREEKERQQRELEKQKREREEAERKEREEAAKKLQEERLALEKERLDLEKRRIEAQKESSALPPAGGAMDAESMLAMMEKAEELKRRRAEEAADKKKAEPVIGAIEAIGSVEYSPKCKSRIDEAQRLYDALPEKVKALVSNHATLVSARAEYEKLEAEPIIDAIKAIGKVELTPECRERIAAARACYSGLTESQRAHVHNADALLAAEREYGEAEAKEKERKRKEAEEREKAIEAVFAMKILPDGGASVQWLLDKGATAATIPERYRGQPVTSIGPKAFSGCRKLKSIAIPSTVTSIGDSAFAGCRGLTALLLPSGLKSIGKEAFYNCSEDLYVCFAPGVDASRQKGFDPNFLKGFRGNVLYGVTDVDQAIRAAQLEAEARREKEKEQIAAATRAIEAIGGVEYSPKCKSRIDEAQRLYDALPKNGKALVSNRATLVSATAEYEKLEAKAEERKRLKEEKAEAIKRIDAIFRMEILPDGNVSVAKCRNEEITGADIPERYRGRAVTSIGDSAFSDCKSLKSIAIPKGVTSIGGEAFRGCSRLTSIAIPESVTSIGERAFSCCPRLTSITIPEGVTSIGNGTFSSCEFLASIVIPKGVTSIGNGAFFKCSSLESIIIPESVTSIGEGAFEDCTSLTSIAIPESVTSIGESAFSGCPSLTSIVIPKGVTSIGESAFSGCPSLTSIVIPKGVTSIGKGTFRDCKSLKSIAIPESVTSIGGKAFLGCESLTSIIIPSSVTSIGSHAFCGCFSLASIVIPKGVDSIGKQAFSECSSLTSITIPESVTSIGDYAFEGCKSLTSITIPKGVTSIGELAFWRCTSLTSIAIPESVTSIGKGAFYDCSCDVHFAHKKPLFGYPKGFPVDCLKEIKGKVFWGGK